MRERMGVAGPSGKYSRACLPVSSWIGRKRCLNSSIWQTVVPPFPRAPSPPHSPRSSSTISSPPSIQTYNNKRIQKQQASLPTLPSLPSFPPFKSYKQLKMKQKGIKRQLFPQQSFGQIDPERLQYNQMLDSMRQDQQKPDERIKRAVNINLFRQQTRRQQRDFHQQNHQFLKMCGIMVRSSFDENKFNYIGQSNRKTNNFTKGNTNSKNVNKQSPLVHVSLDNVEFSCSLIPEKFPIKQLYQLFPLRRDSIIFQAHENLSSQYIFFLYQHENQTAETLRYKLESTIEEGILAEFKSSINKAFKNISYFDYLYFINKKSMPSRVEHAYPDYIEDIAANNSQYLLKLEEDEKDLFNHDEITVNELETCERVIICEDTDIIDNGENLCFETLDDYAEYKRQKAIDFKNQKIFEKDAVINTNIRNIISTEKIYMVEIIEEVKSYIQLSHECEGTAIMSRVYEHLVNKADEYLRLLCGYTDSKILTIYNIENYQEKIYKFLEKSIRYKKELRNISPEVLKEFPVLEIWFKLPDNLLGYSREELHETFYALMEAIIVFEEKMRANELYESLKVKRANVKYIPK